MRPFRVDGGRWTARLEAPERAVLTEVVDDVLALLDGPDVDPADPLAGVGPDGGDVRAPQDPAVLRLLPPGSADPDVAAEYRRLTEADLRATKRTQLRVLRRLLGDPAGRLRVEPAEAPAVAAALTDVRLVASERLEVRTDEDADALYRVVLEPGAAAGSPDEAHRLLATVYVLFSVLQESLVDLMLGDLDTAAGGSGGPRS